MPQKTRLEEGHELRDLVRNALAGNPYFTAREVSVDVEQSDVVLRGAVRSWYQKQIAQESVRRIGGIGAIRNELQVVGS